MIENGWFIRILYCAKENRMGKTVLITGGAGIIGSHFADASLDSECNIRVLDNLCEQVHGRPGRSPKYLNDNAELIVGDVHAVRCAHAAIDGVDAVFHFAARAGVGKSMHRVADYIAVNSVWTATLPEEPIEHPVKRLICKATVDLADGLRKLPAWREGAAAVDHNG